MGYTEILEIDSKGEGVLKTWYDEYETAIKSLEISKTTKIRFFVC